MDQKARTGAAPCRPVVLLWIFSIAQYGYRYIFHVNDPGTSSQYEATPPALSAIKYGIFLLFALYALRRFGRRPMLLGSTYRTLLSVTAYSILLLPTILLVRTALLPGAISDTVLCFIQFLPWVSAVFLIPFVFTSEHSLRDTLVFFESLAFWTTFPFWLTTVVLVILGIRYPALSYPGALVRFGGILDDPNGYACLCLFLLVLSLTIGQGARRFKGAVYGLMLAGTLSFSGYITGVVMCVYLLPSWLARSRTTPGWKLLRIAACGSAVLALIAIPMAIYETNSTVIDALALLYSGKTASAATHLSNLRPDEAVLDVSSPVALLCGSGGFSENFYWRIVANFGWLGLLTVAGVIAAWTYCALRAAPSRPIGAWLIGLLVGCNGIAYLLNFPLNLIYWSLVALLLRAGERELRTVRAAPATLAVA